MGLKEGASRATVGQSADEPPGPSKDEENEMPLADGSDDPNVLHVRNYMSLNSLLPSPEEWDEICHRQKMERIRFLVGVSITYLVLWVAHAPVAIWKTWSLQNNAELKRLLSDRPGLGQPLPPNCIVTKCAALCPEPSDTKDWYTLFRIPYATLPQQSSYFSAATYPFTFKECYLAYWHGVAKEKRRFIDGQIRFIGREANDDGSECAQLKNKKGELVPVGKPQSCLTLSFHYPWFSSSHTEEKQFRGMPIVAYIGGSYLMNHRPQLPSPKMVADLRVLYVAISYRLGVFGFSDFGIDGAGPNHGVSDVREALIWIQEHAHRFGGDPSRVMLYGENSGATIAAALLSSSGLENLMVGGESRSLFSHVWLADGSVVIPDVPDSQDAFQQLVLNDPYLADECKKWVQKSAKHAHMDRSHPLARMYECLHDMTVQQWLQKTPLAWQDSRTADTTLLPQAHEMRTSLIKRDLENSLVENPLGMLHPKATGWTHSIRDMPLVVFSSMNYAYDQFGNQNSSDHWNLEETEQKLRNALNSFRKPTSQLPYADAMWNAYQGYLRNLIAWRRDDQAPEEINYRNFYDVIRGDLRGACPYNLYAKHLQLGRYIMVNPIYRILNRIQVQPYVDADGARCDVPFFLIDEHFYCGEGTRPLYEALEPEQKEVLVRAFVQFAYYGSILGAREMQYPLSSDMPSLEATYNILTEMGLTTAGTREIAFLKACQMWISEEGLFEHVMKYAQMN
uniref:Carboxyl-esterase B n=1 Tax=Fasciola hepatica TaxID=6192 RepID=A0A8A1L7B4_FASHE|nr:carboxyl-esterase B [Fasciola hepatica]URZ95336.1 carboxyl-esterase B [Fasciola hepatica]